MKVVKQVIMQPVNPGFLFIRNFSQVGIPDNSEDFPPIPVRQE